MKLIGRVADGATETKARLILLKGMENHVVAEDLVLIKNGGETNTVNEILGVLREGLGKNEFLSYTSYRPDVAYLRHGGEPSGAREVYSFAIEPIGVITSEGIEPNRTIIQPRSPVYLLEDENDKPLEYIAKGRDVVWSDAYIEGHPNWKVPFDKNFISYHTGVYGSTGCGKSWFTRYILIPLYRRVDYKVLILDWSGSDYVPLLRSDEVVKLSEIALDEESILSYFSNKTLSFSRNETIKELFDEFIEGWHAKVKEAYLNSENPSGQLYKEMRRYIEDAVASIEHRVSRTAAQRALRRIFRRLKPSDLQPVMGILSIEELLIELERRGILAIDMGGALTEAKLGFFLSLSRYLYSLMELGKNLGITIIIDEAPQYAPWDARGIQAETCEMIKNLAALGRKRMLNLTLISQGIKGEIGVNAAVRRNLNTHFFGRIHPLDASGEGGASEWLSPYGISASHLLQLRPGRFYFAGAMNPSPVPLLITYNPPAGAG
ncbi:MAG: ATP-binding protein [Candidatus Bathyarchaeia archaeon]